MSNLDHLLVARKLKEGLVPVFSGTFIEWVSEAQVRKCIEKCEWCGSPVRAPEAGKFPFRGKVSGQIYGYCSDHCIKEGEGGLPAAGTGYRHKMKPDQDGEFYQGGGGTDSGGYWGRSVRSFEDNRRD